MTVPKLAIHAGSLPAAPTIVPVCQIGPHSHRQSGRAPCDPRVCTNTYHRPPSQGDRVDRSRPTSFRPTLRPIPHSACCTLRALPTAISCLGAFRTPAAGARGWHRGCRRPKTLYGALEVKQRIHGMLFFPSTQFLCSTRKPISSPRPASSECCRAQGLSRLAVAQISRHAPAMPGHTLTAPSTAAGSLWSG